MGYVTREPFLVEFKEFMLNTLAPSSCSVEKKIWHVGRSLPGLIFGFPKPKRDPTILDPNP